MQTTTLNLPGDIVLNLPNGQHLKINSEGDIKIWIGDRPIYFSKKTDGGGWTESTAEQRFLAMMGFYAGDLRKKRLDASEIENLLIGLVIKHVRTEDT